MPIETTVDGVEINLVRTGPRGGVPILFIHALGLDLSIWENQFEEFGRDNDVIAIDLPGHGLSGISDSPPTFVSMARIMAGLIAQLRIGPAHIVGISVGGMIAQTLAITSPALVRSLCLVATSCTFPTPVRDSILNRATAVRAGGMETIAPLHLERWFPPDFRAKRPEVIDRLYKVLLRQKPEVHAALWDMVATLNLEQRLVEVTCPAMVVAGEHDISALPAVGQLIVNQIAGSTLRVVPDSGHFPPLECPAIFNALLQDFLHQI